MIATMEVRPGLLLMFVASAFVLLAGVWVSNGVIAKGSWPINSIQIDGEFQRIAVEQVQSAVVPVVSGNFFSVDLEKIRESAESQPWIKRAVVRKIWPDRIQVQVLEYIPLAHWASGQLIDDSGEIFTTPQADNLSGLPWLGGPEGMESEVLRLFAQGQIELQGTGLTIRRFELSKFDFIEIGLNSNMQLKVGLKENNKLSVNNNERKGIARTDQIFVERLKKFVSLLPQLRERYPDGLLSVDLRYSNGMAIEPVRRGQDDES